MKSKKTLAIIAALVTALVAGAVFGPKIIKAKEEKKEKEAIEKELESVLIPGAEKKLNDLLNEHKELQDSIDWYEAALNELNYEAGQNDNATGGNDSVLNAQLQELQQLVTKIQKESHKKWQDAMKPLEKRMIGEDGKVWFEGENELSDQEFEFFWHLSDEALLPLKGKDFRIPYNMRSVDETRNYEIFSGTGEDSYDEYIRSYPRDGYRSGSVPRSTMDSVLKSLIHALHSTQEAFEEVDEYSINLVKHEYKVQNSYKDIYRILTAVQIFANNVDNSRGVINQKTLDEIKEISSKLLKYIEPHVKIEETSKQIDAFRSGAAKVDEQIDRERKVVRIQKSGCCK